MNLFSSFICQVVLSFPYWEQFLTQLLSLCLVLDLMHKPSFLLAWGEKCYSVD